MISARLLRFALHGTGWRAAYAEIELVRFNDQGWQPAVDAVWQAWLHRPDPRWWTPLQRWHRPAAARSDVSTGLFDATRAHRLSLVALDTPSTGWSAEGLADAVAMTGHPIAAVARRRLLDPGEHIRIDDVCLAAVGHPTTVDFLTAQMILPAEPAARAAYLLLTGQQQPYWELDPDQRLLARAYRDHPMLRPLLRDAIPEFGDIDPLRVLTPATGGARTTADEIAYLAARMVRDNDSHGLWRFARDLPPADAAFALRDARADYRPDAHDGAELYDLLRAAGDTQLRQQLAALTEPRVLTVDHGPYAGAFSADDRMFAATTFGPEGRYQVEVFDLHRDTPPERYDLGDRRWATISFEGSRTVLATAPARQVTWPEAPRFIVWRLGMDERPSYALPGEPVDLKPLSADGSVQLLLLSNARGYHRPQTLLVRGGGPPTYRTPKVTGDSSLNDWVLDVLDTDPVRGRVAVLGSRIVVAELRNRDRLHVLAASPPRLQTARLGLCLAGPDRLFTCENYEVVRWRINGGELTRTASGPIGIPTGPLAWVPYRNAVAALGQGRIHYLDADTLQPQDQPGGLDASIGHVKLWASPSGTGTHASTYDRQIHVVLASSARLADLARQPMSQAAVPDSADSPILSEKAGLLLSVLDANRRYRSGSTGRPG